MYKKLENKRQLMQYINYWSKFLIYTQDPCIYLKCYLKKQKNIVIFNNLGILLI